jgi:hypothetical protein
MRILTVMVSIAAMNFANVAILAIVGNSITMLPPP